MANLVYVVLLVGGGLVVPVARYPAVLRPVVDALPTAALGEGLRAGAAGRVLAWTFAVLLAWLVVAVLAARRGSGGPPDLSPRPRPEGPMTATELAPRPRPYGTSPWAPLLRLVTGPVAMRRWAVAALVINMIIVVTGGLVRLTASGHGLPDLAALQRRTPSSPTRRWGSTGRSSSATGC